MTDYIPNDAQQKALDFLQEYPDEQEYTLQLPTGVGKSFLIMDKIYLNDRVMIVFPRLALLSQFYRDYISKYLSQRAVIAECTDQKDIKDTAKKDVDCYKSLSKKRTLKDEDEIIILTTYHSCSSAISKYEYLDATIFDEAHHRSEAKIMEFLEDTTNKEKCGVIYNFSATCDEEFNEGAWFKYPFQEAIKNRLIRDFSVHVMICSQKNRKPKNPQHFVKQVEHIARLSKQQNPKYMAFSAFSTAEKENRSNVTEVVKEWSTFNEFWVKGITGNTKPNDREKIFKDFADHKGSFATLVSCRTLGEGIDIPNVNGAVFIDPRSSTREIIQIIGRALRLFRDSEGIPLPWEQQLPAIIVLPVYIDTDEYEAIDNDQDQDNYLRDAVENQEKGSFATVLNVASALREHNPEMSELCLFYPQGCPSKDIPKIRQYLGTQGYRIQEVPADGNCFFSCLAEAIPDGDKSAGDWRQEIIADLQERPFQEFGIDLESVEDLYMDRVWNNEAMDVVPEVAAEHLGRCIRIHHGDGRVDSFGSSDTSVGPIDLLLSDNHYSLLIPESDSKKSMDAPQCSKEKPNSDKRAQPRRKKFHFHLDEETRVLWKLRPDVLSRGLGELEHRIEKSLGGFTPEQKAEFLIAYANKQKKAPSQSTIEKQSKNGMLIDVRLGKFWNKIKCGQNKEFLQKLLENEFLKKDYQEYVKKKESKPMEEPTPEEKVKLLIAYVNKEKKAPTQHYYETITNNQEVINVKLGQFWTGIKYGNYRKLLPKLLENEILKKDYDKYLRNKELKPTEDFTPEEKANLLIAYVNKEGKAPFSSYSEKHTKKGVGIDVKLGLFWTNIKSGHCKNLLPQLLENEHLKKAYDEFVQNKQVKSSVRQEDDISLIKTEKRTGQDDNQNDEGNDDDISDKDNQDETMFFIKTTAKEDEILDKDAEIQRLKKQLKKALEKQNKTGYKNGQYYAPNTESKKKINEILADHLPSKGLVIVLDHTDFGTASTLEKKDFNLHKRLLIPERNPEYFKKMKKDAKFGGNVRQEDMIDLLKRKNKEPSALVYVDLMGSIKEAEPILDQLKQCQMVEGGIIAITISCRDGEEADYTNQFARKLTRACYKRWPSLHELTDNEDVLVYGEGVRMATMIFRI